MDLKVNLIHPEVVLTNKIVTIKIKNNLSQTELTDWIFHNKEQILKDTGCNLTDEQLASAVALGLVTIKIINEAEVDSTAQ